MVDKHFFIEDDIMARNQIEKSKIGKKSRAAGQRFEKRVRQDIEKKGWTIDKWGNNVEFQNDAGRLIPAKPKFAYNPIIKRRMPIGMSSGFPDFAASRPAGLKDDNRFTYDLIGLESKMNGKLDKIEKEKCEWLLKNHIFSKIFIAQKGIKRGEIIYKEVPGGEKMADEGTQTADSIEEDAADEDSEDY